MTEYFFPIKILFNAHVLSGYRPILGQSNNTECPENDENISLKCNIINFDIQKLFYYCGPHFWISKLSRLHFKQVCSSFMKHSVLLLCRNIGRYPVGCVYIMYIGCKCTLIQFTLHTNIQHKYKQLWLFSHIFHSLILFFQLPRAFSKVKANQNNCKLFKIKQLTITDHLVHH